MCTRIISTPLIERVAAEKPDLVIFKGLDYALVDALVERLDPSCDKRIAFVIGGVAVHPTLKSACLVLTESEQQTQAIYDFLGRRIPIRILSKVHQLEGGRRGICGCTGD